MFEQIHSLEFYPEVTVEVLTFSHIIYLQGQRGSTGPRGEPGVPGIPVSDCAVIDIHVLRANSSPFLFLSPTISFSNSLTHH